MLTASVAAAAALAERGVTPDLAAGHSLGEYSALVVAGALRFADAVRLVRRRGEFMQEAVPVGTGAMAALMGVDLAAAEQVCAEAAQGEVVGVANINSPGQIVIAGHRAAVERAVAGGRGARRQEERAAAGERALPLRADEAGGRPPRRRSWSASRRQRAAHPGGRATWTAGSPGPRTR